MRFIVFFILLGYILSCDSPDPEEHWTDCTDDLTMTLDSISDINSNSATLYISFKTGDLCAHGFTITMVGSLTFQFSNLEKDTVYSKEYDDLRVDDCILMESIPAYKGAQPSILMFHDNMPAFPVCFILEDLEPDTQYEVQCINWGAGGLIGVPIPKEGKLIFKTLP